MRIATTLVLTAAVVFLSSPLDADVRVERQRVATISSADLANGIVSELTWDQGVLVMQGAIPDGKGQLSARYYSIAQKGVAMTLLNEPTLRMLEYWERKSKRTSPTGLGTIVSASDSQMPMNSLQGREAAIHQASDMGGMQVTHMLRLGSTVILKRSGLPPYDGETYSWSPIELNRLAYTDGQGDLWIVDADGRNAKRLLKGNYTLPAWSEDGRSIAVAERKHGGKTWDLWIVYLPTDLK
jgi:hypothetical protein